MSEFGEIVTIFGVIASIIVSIISAIVALRKNKSEIESSKTDSEKDRAEIVSIYSEEIRKLKDENKLSREEDKKNRLQYEIEINELKSMISEISEKLNKNVAERKEEQLRYREFVNELLLGITMLTGQIQIRGEIPVWVPPTKVPFD